MGKTAIIFPGQGSQYENMGKDFYENYESAKKIFEAANEVSPLTMESLIFEPNEKLNETKYTQIAMLTVELAILEVVKELGIKADVYAGLSLGEYGALAGCGAMSVKDALSLVVKRGKIMQEAVPEGGAMSAVLGLDNNIIEKICMQTEGIVSVANYNCPGQTVITGEKDAVQRAMEQLKEAGAKRCLPLKVSGPFHSDMLLGAGTKLKEELKNVTINDITVPYVSNVTASYVTDKNEVVDLLTKQISSSVRWQQSVEFMIEQGVDQFIEIGPKKTLTGFLKKIDKSVTAINIETVNDLAKLQ